MAITMPRLRLRKRLGATDIELPDWTAGFMKHAVGPGQANAKPDVQLVQLLLNTFGTIPKAPTVGAALKVDGIFGPLTLSAIKSYQTTRFRSSDGVITPGRPTIRALGFDAKIGASIANASKGGSLLIRDIPNPTDQIPLLPDPLIATTEADRLANLGFALLARTVAAAQVAVGVVDRAHNLLRLKHDNEANRKALALVAKHFSRPGENPATLTVYIDFIASIFSRAAANLALRIGAPLVRGFFVGNTTPPESNPLMAMEYGSAWIPIPGLPVGGWIYIFPNFESITEHHRCATIIHEMAHGLGYDRGQANMVRDNAYAHEAKYASLAMGERAHNAATYGAFVHDATFGSPSMVKDQNHVEGFSREPFVSNAGTIT